MKPLLPLLAVLTAPLAAHAQAPPPPLRGVMVARGQPVAGVNVFDIETLEGSVTKADGRFTIAVTGAARARMHLVARMIGFTPLDTTVALTGADSLVIELHALTMLVPISVQAGRYTATAERKTTLTPLEVVSIPGSNADISGAIKTLPGVQNVDEGTGLFVRGGDFTETKMFIDGAPLFSAYQFEAPTGSVAGTVNPFLTSSIAFLSGGFGAEWGNALSGIVDLRTVGRTAQSFANINGSILGLSVGAGLALPHGFSATATIGATNLTAMLDLNGNVRDYKPAPHGHTISAQGVWEYRRTGSVKLFGLLQTNGFGISVVDPAFTTTFTSDRTSDVVVASWSDSIGKWRPFASASTSGLRRGQEKGAYDQQTDMRSMQARIAGPIVFSERVKLTPGAEVERLSATFAGRVPANQYDPTPGAPTVPSSLDAGATRDAVFLSLDTRPTGRTELMTGVRSERSGFATARTTDPRVSFAYVPRGAITLTASWGMYHQVADPAFLDRLSTGNRLPELRSNMAIAGIQVGEEAKQIRVEGWTKSYRELVGLSRSYATSSGLDGRAHGADLFARAVLPQEIKGRVTYSMSMSRRDDPNTQLDAPAPFDVTHSLTLVAQRDWKSGWSAGIAYKLATGRPFTDITGATFDAQRDVYIPQYAAPNAERLPTFTRTDLTLSKMRSLGGSRFLVVFAGLNNLFDTPNTFGYTWSRDYAERIPVRSTVSRTFFIGANLVLTAKQ